MNKKYFYVAIALLCVPLSQGWSIWEGTAGIGQRSDFPGSGLYARSDMFPRNTVVEIINLETESRVRAVITGPSGIPGLVAIVSPETAQALQFRSGSVSRVRIAIASGTEEKKPLVMDNPPGSSVRTNDPDTNPSSFVTSAEPVPVEPAVAAETVEEPVFPPSLAVEENSVPLPAESPEIVLEPLPVEETDTLIESVTVYEEPDLLLPTVAEEEYALTDEEFDEAAHTALEEPVETELAETAPIEPETEVTLVPADLLPPPALVMEPVIESEKAGTVAAAPESPVREVPTPVPPVVQPKEMAPIREASAITAMPPAPPAAAQPQVIAPAIKAPIVPSASPAIGKPEAPSALPFMTSLVPGSLYVQIASYAELTHAATQVEKYRARYPVAVEKTSGTRGDLYKVYIGPLRQDEGGAVLERFKSFGFSDAFIKKGN